MLMMATESDSEVMFECTVYFLIRKLCQKLLFHNSYTQDTHNCCKSSSWNQRSYTPHHHANPAECMAWLYLSPKSDWLKVLQDKNKKYISHCWHIESVFWSDTHISKMTSFVSVFQNHDTSPQNGFIWFNPDLLPLLLRLYWAFQHKVLG